MFKRMYQAILVLMLGITVSAQAQDSGFLSDYSQLEVNPDVGLDRARVYLHPDIPDVMSNYEAVMIDQPELIVASDSKVKSMKPDQMVQVAEGIRATLSDALTTGKYYVVDQQGPKVLLLRVAASHLYLKKAKRGFLSYTPIGAVVHAASQASTDDIAKKLSLVEMSVEAELFDSTTGERLAAFVTQRGQRKDKSKDLDMEPSSWNEMMGLIELAGTRLACRLKNASVEPVNRVDCVAEHPEPAPQPEG